MTFLASLTYLSSVQKEFASAFVARTNISGVTQGFVYTHRGQLAAAEAGLALQHEETSSHLLMLPPCLGRAEYTCRELHKRGTVEAGLLIFRAGRCSQSHPAYMLTKIFQSISFTLTIQNYIPLTKKIKL